MKRISAEVLNRLEGRALVTAESLTGGGIGAALTGIPGSSAVYKGGIICYSNWVKENILGVPGRILDTYGAVSSETARYLAEGVLRVLRADVAVAVTGLAGPGGDDYGHDVGTVFIGYADRSKTEVREHHFSGDREAVRNQTVAAALEFVLINTQ